MFFDPDYAHQQQGDGNDTVPLQFAHSAFDCNSSNPAAQLFSGDILLKRYQLNCRALDIEYATVDMAISFGKLGCFSLCRELLLAIGENRELDAKSAFLLASGFQAAGSVRPVYRARVDSKCRLGATTELSPWAAGCLYRLDERILLTEMQFRHAIRVAPDHCNCRVGFGTFFTGCNRTRQAGELLGRVVIASVET